MRTIQPAIRAYLQYTLEIPPDRRESAAKEIFSPARQRFLDRIPGAVSIELLSRKENIQILAGFDTSDHAQAYRDGPAGRELAAQFARFAGREPDIAAYSVE